jgi:hypothetical protein
MVQMPVHQIVHMVVVGHGGVPAVGPVDVGRVVAGAVVGDAPGGIRGRDGDDVLVVVALVGAVEMAVVEVPHMITVLDSRVAAVGSVDMGVVLVDGVFHAAVSFCVQEWMETAGSA